METRVWCLLQWNVKVSSKDLLTPRLPTVLSIGRWLGSAYQFLNFWYETFVKLRKTTRCHLEPSVAEIPYTNYLHTHRSKKAHNPYTLAARGDEETTEVTKCASELTTYLLTLYLHYKSHRFFWTEYDLCNWNRVRRFIGVRTSMPPEGTEEAVFVE